MNYLIDCYTRLNLTFERGDECYLYDKNNKKYLDFASSFSVTSLGHNNSRLNQALIEQTQKLWICGNLFKHDLLEKYAQKICEMSGYDKVFLCSSGLEANEAAIKFIRRYFYKEGNPIKNEIISFHNGFHGRSISLVSMGANEKAREGFEPTTPGFKRAEFNNYENLLSMISDNTAAIVLETVQSEGGVHIIDSEFLAKVANIAKEKKILLWFDEVQTGFGRSGKFLSYMNYGIKPDIITCSKAIGNGFPLAACLVKEEYAKHITPGSHGSTYGGNALACAVGLEVLNIIEEGEIFKNFDQKSDYFALELKKLKEQFTLAIKEVRHFGYFFGLELKIPALKLVEACADNGLLVTRAGNNDVLRILPSLIAEKEHFDEAISKLTKALADYV